MNSPGVSRGSRKGQVRGLRVLVGPGGLPQNSRTLRRVNHFGGAELARVSVTRLELITGKESSKNIITGLPDSLQNWRGDSSMVSVRLLHIFNNVNVVSIFYTHTHTHTDTLLLWNCTEAGVSGAVVIDVVSGTCH